MTDTPKRKARCALCKHTYAKHRSGGECFAPVEIVALCECQKFIPQEEKKQ